MADYFVHARTDPDYRPTDPQTFKHTDELLKLMAVLRQDERFTNSLKGEGGKPRNMCDVLDRLEQKKEVEVNERVAKKMLRREYPLSEIEEISTLSEESIRKIAKNIGVAVL